MSPQAKRLRRRALAAATAAIMSLLAASCSSDGTPTTDGTAAPTDGTAAVSTVATASDGVSTRQSATSAPMPPAAATEVLTPIVATANTEPTPVTGTDGRTYLAYELLVINVTATPVTIDSLQALDGQTGTVLQEYTGGDLVAHSRVIGARASTPPTSVALSGGQAGLLWLDPSVADGEAVPTLLRHTITATFQEPPNPLLPAKVTETIAEVPVNQTPAAVIAAPLRGANWLDGNGCCDEVTAHRGAANPINGQYFFAERFAVDWVQLDDQMRILNGDPTTLASYAYYDSPVYAVADGTVVSVVDGLIDQVPGANPPPGALQVTEFGGNHVVQRFDQNDQTYFAFYAHLVPGSATENVQVGQEIKAGDVIGRLGNSGNSDSPHLHFHVMDTPNPLASNGLPYVFQDQDLVGTANGNAAINAALQGGALTLTPGGPSGPRTNAMPLTLDVVDLPSPS